jgi:uncharacterized protein (TIGR00296 family)
LVTLDEGKFLVRLARNAVSDYLRNGLEPSPPEDTPPPLRSKSGVFVTIEEFDRGRKALRGCIGYPLPYAPLVEATIDSAISAATRDPRFEPMVEAELTRVVFEVSVLSPPSLIKVDRPRDYPKRIKVARDGLVVEMGFHKGLLLPQVPVEWGWDESTFLSECCMKAGLPPDSWLSKDIKVYSFRAQVFSEASPSGEIARRDMDQP